MWLVQDFLHGATMWLGKSRVGESGGQPFWQFSPELREAHTFDTFEEAAQRAASMPGSKVVSKEEVS